MAEQEVPLAIDTPYLNAETWSYKGVEFDWMGVAHTWPTFETYKEEFKERFNKADAILMEGAPKAEGLVGNDGKLLPEAINEYKKIYRGASEPEIRALFEGVNTSLAFYGALENLAGEMGKDILVFDPFVMDPKQIGSNEEMSRLESKLKLQKALLLGVVPVVAGGASLGFLARDLVNKHHSRRTFIFGATAATAAGMMTLGLGSDEIEKNRWKTPKRLNSSNPLSPGLADLTDYRNAAIVFTATALADRGELDLHLGSVYGDVHRAQIKRNFQNPWEMELKLATVYKGMQEVSPPRYRRFSNQGGRWVKTTDRVITKP